MRHILNETYFESQNQWHVCVGVCVPSQQPIHLRCCIAVIIPYHDASFLFIRRLIKIVRRKNRKWEIVKYNDAKH